MTRRFATVVLVGLLLVFAPATRAGAASADCLEALLQRLGWRLHVQADATTSRWQAGDPCQRRSLDEARAAGDLQLWVPATLPATQREAVLQQALAHPATRCAYLFELAAATRRATTALAANPGYRFTALQLGWIGFGWQGASAQGWERFRSFGRGYRPSGSNTRALDAFYHGRVRSECGVGRQVAQLATQRELYGDAAFNAEFSAGELSIGTFLTLHDTDSILLGRHAGEFFADGKAEKTSRLGAIAFAGVPGYLVHAFPSTTLDDINNQAQNFVVDDVDAPAYMALREHAGFAYYDGRNQRLWDLATQLRAAGRDDFMDLLWVRDAQARGSLTDGQRALVAAMEDVLADPFYGGFRVYVHHRGVQPIAYHVIRMLERNPRTPYVLELTLHNLHTSLYQRWIQRQLRDCPANHPEQPVAHAGPRR